jgi:NAD(P)-dependent dehydrogenase (short-subunit alcohol dehydrogenase family)
MPAPAPTKTILLIGASRGLGHAMAAAFLQHGWNVTATIRAGAHRTALHDLADAHPGRVDIEILDITDQAQLAALHTRLAGQQFDMLFVNAGTGSQQPTHTVGEFSTEDFFHVMLTNALSPMRVIEKLAPLVTPTGTIGVMSSGRGSLTNNTAGAEELYRGSKAALNMFMRSFAARHATSQHPMVLMAPGWVRTALGGANGRLSIEESVPNLVNVLLAQQGKPGLQYLDYLGRTVPW